MNMDQVKFCVPEGHGVGPAKPQHKGLCDVHALRAHHGNNVFEQGGGGRSTNNLLPDTERPMSRLNVRESPAAALLPSVPQFINQLFVPLKPLKFVCVEVCPCRF